MKLSTDKISIIAKSDDEERTIKIQGKPENLDQFEKLCHWIEFLGQAGHSATASIFVDGDGAGYMKFTGLREDTKPTEKDIDENGDPELKVGLT